MSGAPSPTGLSNLELLQNALDGTASLRTRTVWLVGRPGTGKTTLLRALAHARPECEYINVNRELAKALIDRPAGSRSFDAPGRLSAVLPPRPTGAWLADNTELPLSRELQLAVQVPTCDACSILTQFFNSLSALSKNRMFTRLIKS